MLVLQRFPVNINLTSTKDISYYKRTVETDKQKILYLRMVFVSIIAVVFAAGFLILATVRLQEIKKTVLPVNQSTNNTIPASNLEWLANETLVPRTLLKKIVYTTVVAGEITEIKRGPGRLSGFKDYYTGPEKGYYVYGGYIRLKPVGGGKGEIYYFSPRIMEIMGITDFYGKKISFDELTIGSMVEIEETADLVVSNINDQNVISLAIKVIK